MGSLGTVRVGEVSQLHIIALGHMVLCAYGGCVLVPPPLLLCVRSAVDSVL